MVCKHMMNYKRGDVVLVKFPMPDLSLFKPRPALIVQNDNNNKRLSTTILLQITSNVSRKDEATQFFISLNSDEGLRSGLKTDSVIKAESIFTLAKDNIYKVIGTLSNEALLEIDKCIKISLELK